MASSEYGCDGRPKCAAYDTLDTGETWWWGLPRARQHRLTVCAESVPAALVTARVVDLVSAGGTLGQSLNSTPSQSLAASELFAAQQTYAPSRAASSALPPLPGRSSHAVSEVSDLPAGTRIVIAKKHVPCFLAASVATNDQGNFILDVRTIWIRVSPFLSITRFS